MARRGRKPAVASKSPNDGTKWGHLSDAELVKEFAKELARRRAARGGPSDLDAIESFSLDAQRELGQEALAATIESLPSEESTPKPCPKCGALVRVNVRNRVRTITTVSGELRLSRNYHYCAGCKHGFYPRDAELRLPEEGVVSDAMERRILDFGVNTGFEEAAQRWAIHYPSPISENLVRRVVDRVGGRAESAYSEEALQQACIPTPPQPPKALVIAGDGSMLKTREENWKEAKVAVVAAGESIIPNKGRNQVEQARYVAVLGGNDEFKKSLDAALKAARADEVTKVAWLGDGAPENFIMATELCPSAIQILDVMHAIQNAMDCAKVLLGENDPGLPLWQQRIGKLIDAVSPDAALRELMDCLPLTQNDAQLVALNKLVGYYRRNEKRMRYSEFREMGLPIGSGIVESAHGHVLQVRMKRSGQSWSIKRGRRMARLRALYKTAGPRRFHWAIREALKTPPSRAHSPLPNGPRRRKQSSTPSRVSPLARRAAAK